MANDKYSFTIEATEDEGDNRFLLRLMERYLIQLKEIEPCDMPKGPAFKWHFVVLSGKKFESEDSAKGLKLQHLTSQKLSPSTKLWKFVQDMLGRPLNVGDQINPNELIDKYFVTIIEHNESNGKTYNRISSIQKYTPKKKA